MDEISGRRLHVGFVNTGILGHRSVARLIRDAVSCNPGIDPVHLDLSAHLTPWERIRRRALTAGPRPGTPFGALTRARYRHELDAGLRAARRLAKMERSGHRFDVFHFHTQAAAWGSLARMSQTPAIVSIDATQHLASLETASAVVRHDYAAGAERDRRVFASAAAIVATSRWAADDVVRTSPELEAKVHVLPYPVLLEGFDRSWIEARRARSAADPVRVLFIGGDFARKGGAELLAAWRAGGFATRAVLTLVTDAEVGPLPDGVSVRRGVQAYTPEWFAAWRDADVFAMPTRGEAFGMVYQEAAAAGIPVVGSAINAVPEIVVDGETGFLVAPGDGAALIGALRMLIEAPGTRHRIGSLARGRIESTGSIRDYGDRLVELVREVARG